MPIFNEMTYIRVEPLFCHFFGNGQPLPSKPAALQTLSGSLRSQGEMTERVLLSLRQRYAQHQTDADSQRHRNFKGADALGKGKGVFVLDEIVGGVVDARAGHQREDAGQQKDRHRRFEQDGEEPGHQRQRDDRDEGSRRGIGSV